MFTRYFIGIVFLAFGLFSFASCDSAEIAESPSPQENAISIQTDSPEFAQARRQLDASLIPNSIDDIFVKLADRFDGFGGVYENEEGQLVLVSTLPENARAVQDELVAELFEMTETNDKSRRAYLSKEIPIKPAVYSFTELAIYRDLVERNLVNDIPLVFTDVDERENVVVIGLDKAANTSTGDILSKIAKLGIPLAAIALQYEERPQVAMDIRPIIERPELVTGYAPSILNYVRPMAGGLRVEQNGGGCSMGVPVWHGPSGNQQRGFLTASHCTGFVGFNNNSQWSQPSSSSSIGSEFEDPALIPSASCGGGNDCVIDAALIDMNAANDNSSKTSAGEVFLTNFSSSTGAGGFNTNGTVSLSPGSAFMGQDVNKVGIKSGWTTGEITGTCATLASVSMNTVSGTRPLRLSCYTRASTPVGVGDSGSALFSIIYDPEPAGGIFLGILSACIGCSSTTLSTNAYYVSWSAINQGLNQYVTFYEDQGGL